MANRSNEIQTAEPNRRRFLRLNRDERTCEIRAENESTSRHCSSLKSLRNGEKFERCCHATTFRSRGCCDQNASGGERNLLSRVTGQANKGNERKGRNIHRRHSNLLRPGTLLSRCSRHRVVRYVPAWYNRRRPRKPRKQTLARVSNSSSSVHISQARSVSSIFLRIVQRDMTHITGDPRRRE